LEAIQSLLAQQDLQASLAHRNFSEQSDEDLESLLDQLEYIISQRHKDLDE
jgi:hypothetical protein